MNFLDFLNEAVSPFHSVQTVKARLLSAGFEYLPDEKDWWNMIKPGGKYFTHRNHSSIMAVKLPKSFHPDKDAFLIAAGHTDSPCPRLRPKLSSSKEGVEVLECELYGGGLWHTWFDRALGLAGKVIYEKKPGHTVEVLVNIDDPVCFIPNLCIHLQSAEERKGFAPCKENHVVPLLMTATGDEGSVNAVKQLIAEKLKVKPESICDMDMCLYDCDAKAKEVGMKKEFVLSGRLDNQISVYATIEALIEANVGSDALCAVHFDHEEVGSRSSVGADSETLRCWLERLNENLTHIKEFGEAKRDIHFQNRFWSVMSRSFVLSVDGAHATHPNYPSKHQKQHMIKLGGGVVLKTNENQRYTTNATGRALARKIAKSRNVKLQDFVVPNNSPCGSTIGPSMSSLLGCRTLDCGAPMLAMHSARESCHKDDVVHMKDFTRAFYEAFREIDSKHERLE